MINNWEDIKQHREEKGVSLNSLSEKMRLPMERIEYLEAGDFSDADPIITKLQLKNYAKFLDLDYDLISNLAGFNTPIADTAIEPLGESLKIKNTHSYRGRKRAPKKWVVYTLIIIASIVVILLLNRMAVALNISSDVFEMTEQQINALDPPLDTKKDSNSFKPSLPQVQKEEVDVDIISTMTLLTKQDTQFPFNIKIFPANDIVFRQETKNFKNIENYILKDVPSLINITRPGRTLFYNSQNTRFVIDDYEIKDNDISLILLEVNQDRELRIYTK